MTSLSMAAHHWVANKKSLPGSKVSIVDIPTGMAASRKTGVGHYVADAAEITVKGETTLVLLWLCGGSTIDGFILEEPQPDCVGCRLAAALPSGPCVYYAWGENDELLYVGSSINLPQRIRQHSTSTPWWSEVRCLTFDAFDSERAVRRAEMAAIRERAGLYNREGRRSHGLKGDEALLRLIAGGESA
jgi:hypothetical protein